MDWDDVGDGLKREMTVTLPDGREVDYHELGERLGRLLGIDILVVDPDIINYMYKPENDPHFWEDRDKSQYSELAAALPELYMRAFDYDDREIPFLSLRDDSMQGELRDKAMAWFSPLYMVAGNIYQGVLYGCDGRHRCMVAKELGYPVPILIRSNTY